MVRFFILVFILCPLMAYAACESGDAPRTGSTLTVTVTAGTPNGGTAEDAIFTYAFNSNSFDCNCGQFANGDYWIAPATGETEVTITAITTTSAGSITADDNPVMESMGLMDNSNTYGNYDATEELIADLPVTYGVGDGIVSIVAAIQRDEATEGNCGTSATVGECVDAYNVLTVLTAIPTEAGVNTLRPNITGETKELIDWDNFDLTKIPSKDYFTGTDAAGLEAIRARWSHSTEIFGFRSVNNDTGYSEGGRAFRSHILIDDYGAGVASKWYDDFATLFSSDNTLSEKKPALSAMLAYGLDIYHNIYNAPVDVVRSWGTGASQHPGKYLPAVFLAAIAVDSKYSDDLVTVSSVIRDAYLTGPAELAQIFDEGGTVVWGDTPNLTGIYLQGAYWASLLSSQCYDGAAGECNPAIGPKTQADPYYYIDGPPNKPGTSYMQSSLGVQRSLVAVMRLIPRVREIVNYPNLEIYVNRVEDYGLKTLVDQCVTPDSREDKDVCDPYRNKNCEYYGVTWGPINPTDADSLCISDATYPYTKVGRFTELNGDKIDASYTSAQIEANWDTIREEAFVKTLTGGLISGGTLN